VNRPRPAIVASVFFGRRPNIPARSSSSSFSRTDSATFDYPTTTSTSFSQISGQLRSNQAVRSVSVSTTHPEANRYPQPQSASPSDGTPWTPRKVIRPDNWWHNGKSTEPPGVPSKSPLREFFSDLPAIPSSPAIASTADASIPDDTSEQEALRLELTPPPLRFKKRHSDTSPSESPVTRTFAPLGSQANLEPADELPSNTQEQLRREVLAKERTTEITKPDLADQVEETEDKYRSRHCKTTLDLLEGSPAYPYYKEFAELTSLCRPERKKLDSKMDSLRPESAAAMTAHRREAIRLAKSQEQAVTERCKRSNQDPPGYSFDELIGKGSFGRVYKGFGISPVCLNKLTPR
jgi:hypothetical protein